MRVIKVLTGLCFVLGVVIALYVYMAGVNLVLENQSGQEIQNVEVSYHGGALLIDRIYDKGIQKRSLGKIGEGATFDVRWREVSSLSGHVQFGVYFPFSFSPTITIHIWIFPHGEVIFFDGDRLQKQDSK